MPISISEQLKAEAKALGFAACHMTGSELPFMVAERLNQFIEMGYAGDMDWLARAPHLRASPHHLWPEACSSLVLAFNYGHHFSQEARLSAKDTGVISVYALNRDYHELIKGKLKLLAGRVAHLTQCDVKVFVDTAPLMEKPLAQMAGLGWQGKHTNLVSRNLGSWFFLGVILTRARLDLDGAEMDHCGSCRACLDSCPTGAFPAPYQLDARLCISYLTIEHKGMIDAELRPLFGNRIYGCDDCLAACPWNKFAQTAQEIRLQARADLVAPPLADLVLLDDAGFRRHFSGSPLKRIGRIRFVRNVLIAIGNSANPTFADVVQDLLQDPAPLIRAMAVWALAQLLPAADFSLLKIQYAQREDDPDVCKEWGVI